MLTRRGQLQRWKDVQFLQWLTFLAKQMHRQQQTIFLVEDLQPDWLPSIQERLYRRTCMLLVGSAVGGPFFVVAYNLLGVIIILINMLVSGLAFGLAAALSPKQLTERFVRFFGLTSRLLVWLLSGLCGMIVDGPATGLFYGLILGLFWELVIIIVAKLTTRSEGGKIRPVEALRWSWKHLRKSCGCGCRSVAGLIFGGAAGSVVMAIFMKEFVELSRELSGSLITLLLGILVGGLVFGSVVGVSPNQLTERANLSPNEGIRRSGRNGLIIGLLGMIVCGSGFTVSDILGTLPLMLAIGLISGLAFGLNAFIYHFVLRFWLWGTNCLPWNLVPFLDEAAERLLLYKVGGNYIFIHHMLLDCFASLDTTSIVHDTPQRVVHTKKPGMRILVSVALIILVVIFSVVGERIYQNHVDSAAVQAQTTATAQAIANNLYPSYLPGKGTLAFVDPLSQESGSQWSSYNDGLGGVCQFTEGAYHVSEQQKNVNWICRASGTFSDFAFEVQMVIVQGNWGGISIRENSQGQFYNLWIRQDGRYQVIKYTNYSGSDTKTLRDSKSSAINTGLGQQNKIAVEASGSTMTFYVNEQQIDREQDSSSTSGLIGLISTTDNDATDVVYSNARLWTL